MALNTFRLLQETGDLLLQETGEALLLDGNALTLFIAGTDRSSAFDREAWSVSDHINEQPNTLSCEVFGFTPAVDETIALSFGYLDGGGQTLFSGTITSVRRLRFKSTQGRVVFSVQAIDGTRTLDARLVTKAYTTQSATTIVADLISTYATGITTTAVEASLASVATEFKMQRLSEALTQLANLVGAFWYLDYDDDLHFFVTAETGDLPETLNSTNVDVREFTYEQDVTQLRNRIFVEGIGTSVLSATPAGATQIPIEDAVSFDADGGVLAADGNQLLTYTGRVLGGSAGRLASSASAPGGAPSVAEGAVGHLAGAYQYKVSFASASGETAGGPASSTVNPSAFSTPTAPTVGADSTTWAGTTIGTANYGWKVTFVTAEGETTGGTAVTGYSGLTIQPTSALSGLSQTTGGGLTLLATYYYQYTYRTSLGETLLSTGTAASYGLTGTNNAIAFTSSGLPDPPTGAVMNLYRTLAGGASSGPYYFVATIDATASYTDTAADTSLGGGPPNIDTAGGQSFDLGSVATGPTGVLARRIYRTKSGGSEYFLVGQISDNSTTTYNDLVSDAALGVSLPLVNTAGGHVVSLTSIPTGGTGITQRILYRTKASGSEFFYCGSINDNTTTTYTDDAPDTSLGRLALSEATIGALAGDTSITLSTVSGFPTAGWARSGSLLFSYSGITSATLTGIPGQKSVTSITRSGSTATVTATSHGYVTGYQVTIQGATQAEYNGTFVVVVTGTNSFTYTVAGTPASPATGTIVAFGPGAILGPLAAGDVITAASLVTGVPASGAGSIATVLSAGSALNLIVQRDDATSQSTYGVREYYVQDRRLSSDGAEDRGDAELTTRKDPIIRGGFTGRDWKLRSGKKITVDHWGLSFTATIMRVSIQMQEGDPHPMRMVEYANVIDTQNMYAVLRKLERARIA